MAAVAVLPAACCWLRGLRAGLQSQHVWPGGDLCTFQTASLRCSAHSETVRVCPLRTWCPAGQHEKFESAAHGLFPNPGWCACCPRQRQQGLPILRIAPRRAAAQQLHPHPASLAHSLATPWLLRVPLTGNAVQSAHHPAGGPNVHPARCARCSTPQQQAVPGGHPHHASCPLCTLQGRTPQQVVPGGHPVEGGRGGEEAKALPQAGVRVAAARDVRIAGLVCTARAASAAART